MSDNWQEIVDAALTVSKDGGSRLASLVLAADDRIEELEAKLRHYKHEVVETALANERDAEAKLAEAVDVDLIEQAISDVLSEGGTYRDAAEYLARTILAELERKP